MDDVDPELEHYTLSGFASAQLGGPSSRFASTQLGVVEKRYRQMRCEVGLTSCSSSLDYCDTEKYYWEVDTRAGKGNIC